MSGAFDKLNGITLNEYNQHMQRPSSLDQLHPSPHANNIMN